MKLDRLVKSTDPAEMRALEEEIDKQIDRIVELLRSLTFDLVSPVLQRLGLIAAVEELCDKIEEQHEIAIVFENGSEPAHLDPEIEIILFQAVRELLRNVAKHAKARHVRVAFKLEAHRLEITVEDDGIGFVHGQAWREGFGPAGGYGLYTIRERMRHLGGRLKILPVQPQGSRIILSVPLSEEENET
jgi:signal transduction histidine kinase